MDNKLIIYQKELYKEIPLLDNISESFCMGTEKNAQLRFIKDKFGIDFSIRFTKQENKWSILCSEKIQFMKEDTVYFQNGDLNPGDDIKIVNSENKQELFSIYLGLYFEETLGKFNKRIDCRQINTFRIGGCATSTIRILKPIINDTEIILTKKNDGYLGVMSNGILGISLNGCEVRGKEMMIYNHDFFSLNGYRFYLCDGWIYFSEEIPINTGLLTESADSAKNHMEYPNFIRSVRQMYEMPSEQIEVLPPKAYTENQNRSLVMTIIPVIITMMFMVVMRFFMGRSAIFALYSSGMMLVSIIMAIWNYKYQGKQYIERMQNRVDKYNQYIQNSEQKILKFREKERRIAKQKDPSLEEQIIYVKDFDARLFERRPEDDDFLSCYLGTGTIEAVNQIKYNKQEYVDIDDPLMDYPEMINKKYKYAENMPVVLALKEKSAIGIIGDRGKLYQFLKNIIINLSITHYFNDVKFCLLMDEADIPYFKWVRWLQNVNNEKTGKKNITFNEKNTGQLLEFLYTELSSREALAGNHQMYETHFVVFAYRTKSVCEHPINRYFDNATDLGFTFIFFEEYPEFLNKSCEIRIFLNKENHGGYIQNAKNGEDIQRFQYPHISMKEVENAALKMSCIFVEETNLESKLTKNITLYELLHITSITQLNLKQRWSTSKIYESMAAPLGVKGGDEIVYLDLHEKFHGPHGLVAGTTGSGKSEILQSYILSMATLFHPYEVSFIIIDFKGGGMVNQFRNLPHLNGAITNIDGKQIERSLKSIRAELVKRQELFAQNEVNHIDDYIKLYKAGKTARPLPHLILIVDEFAELKSEQPEFMKELISAARIGRSLGVHLILATQKPAGVVNDQIWSNSNFKLCLRVQTKEDSNEVLKSPLAAEIREPGRAYLQVGNNELFLLFQSGYSGAVIPREDVGEIKKFKINMVDISGEKIPIFEQKRPDNDTDITQLDAMVDYLSNYCKTNEIQKLPDICLPPLSDYIIYSAEVYHNQTSDVCIPLGYYDNPSRQSQELIDINLTQNNILVVGASQSGKTNILQLIIRAVTNMYSPEHVNFYILDFASMVLKRFENLAYVGGVITLREDDMMKSFMKMIMEELNHRKDILSENGYGSYAVYREREECKMSQIILMMDNIAVFRETFPQYEDAFQQLCREGLAVGISVVVTCTQINAIGFRILSNFSKRIALYSNDASSYGQLFERCRIKPDNIAGRFLIEVDKEIYEGQCFIAFESEKESNRMMEIDKFIAEINEKYKGNKATKLEILPDLVDDEYLERKTNGLHKPYTIPIGVDYLSIDIKYVNILENNIWGILDREHSGTNNFMNYIIQNLVEHKQEEPVKVWIIDHIGRKLDKWGDEKDIIQYSNNPSQIIDYISEMAEVLEIRYQNMLNGNMEDNSREILTLIINSPEAYNLLSGNYKALELYNKLVSQYRGLGVFIILGKMPNTSINFGMSPVIKASREGINIFIFQNIGEQRVIDVSVAVTREYSKNLEIGDAYYILGNNLIKIKTPLCEKNKISKIVSNDL